MVFCLAAVENGSIAKFFGYSEVQTQGDGKVEVVAFQGADDGHRPDDAVREVVEGSELIEDVFLPVVEVWAEGYTRIVLSRRNVVWPLVHAVVFAAVCRTRRGKRMEAVWAAVMKLRSISPFSRSITGWIRGFFVGEEEAVARSDSVFFEDCSDLIGGVEEVHGHMMNLWTCDAAFQWWTLR